ncbi:hypothetical protein BDV95DRAFT_606100 [Massariosphaeria phaeospora]|uniref:Uncharacterized protein n=1 Tax=Massariosphaeria phaeospora TaxID=100035 RepID=A0A7C8IAV3_9PLEO|nr:hypothetical protein BDV95DRAFT_606100 [Massariosphaeria phaeospora]
MGGKNSSKKHWTRLDLASIAILAPSNERSDTPTSSKNAPSSSSHSNEENSLQDLESSLGGLILTPNTADLETFTANQSQRSERSLPCAKYPPNLQPIPISQPIARTVLSLSGSGNPIPSPLSSDSSKRPHWSSPQPLAVDLVPFKVYFIPSSRQVAKDSVVQDQKRQTGFFSHPALVVGWDDDYTYFYALTKKPPEAIGQLDMCLKIGNTHEEGGERVLKLAQGSAAMEHETWVNLEQQFYIENKILREWRNNVIIAPDSQVKLWKMVELLESLQNRYLYKPLPRDLTGVDPGTILMLPNEPTASTLGAPVMVIAKEFTRGKTRVRFLRVKQIGIQPLAERALRARLSSLMIAQEPCKGHDRTPVMVLEPGCPNLREPSYVEVCEAAKWADASKFKTWCWPAIRIQASSIETLLRYMKKLPVMLEPPPPSVIYSYGQINAGFATHGPNGNTTTSHFVPPFTDFNKYNQPVQNPQYSVPSLQAPTTYGHGNIGPLHHHIPKTPQQQLPQTQGGAHNGWTASDGPRNWQQENVAPMPPQQQFPEAQRGDGNAWMGLEGYYRPTYAPASMHNPYYRYPSLAYGASAYDPRAHSANMYSTFSSHPDPRYGGVQAPVFLPTTGYGHGYGHGHGHDYGNGVPQQGQYTYNTPPEFAATGQARPSYAAQQNRQDPRYPHPSRPAAYP